MDPNAASSSPDSPAFLAPPPGSPVYHGFPLVPATMTDGWCYGAITEYEDPEDPTAGDGYVVAPDGSRAGLVWSVGSYPTKLLCRVDRTRWGVYAIAFPGPVRSEADLVACFRHVLPDLKRLYALAMRPPWWSPRRWFGRSRSRAAVK